MTLQNKDIDVYFHMRNHYKRLRNVKSTFISSSPKAVAKRAFCNSPHCNTVQKTMKFEVTHFSNIVHIPYYEVPKGHNCEYSVDRTSDTALLPRPRTRRNPNGWSSEETLDKRFRSQSVGGIPRKLKNSKKSHAYSSAYYNTDHQSSSMYDEQNNYYYYSSSRQSCFQPRRKKKLNMRSGSNISGSTSAGIDEDGDITESSRKSERKCGTGDSRSTSSVEEHEYLQFLLRVTEDIIINNYILNEDIERVFKKHIEMNKHVLDEKKMEQHIAGLAVELNISESQINFRRNDSRPGSPTYVDLNTLSTSCQCEMPNEALALEGFFAETTEENKDFKENLDEIIYHRHSLGRVTECTEPSNSSATMVAKISNQNFLNNFENNELQLAGTQSEMLVASNDHIDLQIRETLSEIVVTDKSSPTDSLKDNTEKALNVDKVEHTLIKEETVSKETPKTVDCGTETSFDTFINIQTTDAKIQANLPPCRVIEQSAQTSPRLILSKSTCINKSTQSTSIVSNKKCDTLGLSEYALTTHPKQKEFSTCTSPEEETKTTGAEISSSDPHQLDGDINNQLEFKLLGDDYDLTPERDTSERYHFLMMDAATSMIPTTPIATTLEEESLLVGDMYELRVDQTVNKRLQTNRESYSYVRKKSVSSEDDTSSSSDRVHVYKEYQRKFATKNEIRPSTIRRHRKITIMQPKVNSCTSTSSTSVRT